MRKPRLYQRKGSEIWWCNYTAGSMRHRRSLKTRNRRTAEKIAREWAKQLDDLYSVQRVEITLSAAIDSFIKNCRDNELAHLTIKGYKSRLRIFLARIGDEDLSLWTSDVAFDKVKEFFELRSGEVSDSKHDRLVLSALFNFLRAKRWYKGENPADAKLHGLRRPRRRMKKPKRCTNREEDLTLRREGSKVRLWPALLLSRWAGMRRGEACMLRWSEINLKKGFADVVGHEGGRKHPRRVWLAPWVVLQLRGMQPQWLPQDENWPLWPHHPCTASDDLKSFCEKHLDRQLSFHDLRASFTTDCFDRGITPKQESRIVGHSSDIAERLYDEYEAENARRLLPPDPLTDHQPDDDSDAESDANVGHY